MNNLKRVLSLGLSGVMLAGLLTVGASAADFTDGDKIEHADAVNTLVALNVVAGKEDGSYFDPEGNVTRAEMAKMIAVAMNGGNDTTTGVKTTPSFSDIKGHWAESYIEFCADLDIISGRGDGTFDPGANVTGLEAAKMILTALGYNAEAYQLIGDKWSSRTDELARAAKPSLYEDLVGVSMNIPATRDVAAQMIWNGLQNHTVKVSPSSTLSNGQITWNYDTTGTATLLKERYNADTEYGYMTGVSYDKDKDEYTYSLTSNAAFGADKITADAVSVASLKTTEDVSNLFGQKVKVVYKDNKDKTVYGIFAAESDVLVSGVVGNLPNDIAADDDSVKYDGETYKLADDASEIPVYNFLNRVAVDALGTYDVEANDVSTFEFIDNDNDGKVNCVVVHPITLAKVSFVGKDQINAGGVYEFSKSDIYEGVAKSDIVAITAKAYTANDKTVITKAESIKGTVDAVRKDEYRVDGEWYSYVNSVVAGSETISAGDEVELMMVNGFIAYSKLTGEAATLENLVYVVAIDGTANAESSKTLGGTVKGDDALLVFTDGTKKTVKAMRVDTYKETGLENKVNVVPAVGLYTYKINKDNIYELKAVQAAASSDVSVGSFYASKTKNLPGGDAIAKAQNGFDEDADKIAGKFIADDAVIFLDTQDTNDSSKSTSQKVITGKELKASSADWGTDAKNTIITKKVSGLETVTVAVLVTEYDGSSDSKPDMPEADDGTGYGYVISKGYAEKNSDGDWVVKFTVWDGEAEVELTATDADNTDVSDAQYKKGAFVEYTKSTKAGEVTDVTALTTEGAITGYDYEGGKDIAFNGTAVEMKDDNKTVVIYVNTKDTKGAEGGEILLADEVTDGVYTKNAVYKLTSDGKKVDVLFMDVNNSLKGATYTIASLTSWSDTAVNGISAIADNSTATSAKAGDSVELKVALTGTVAADKQVKITATITKADSTTITLTKTLQAGATGNISMGTFEMPAMGITGITFAVEDATPPAVSGD